MVPDDRIVIYLPGPCPVDVAPSEFRHGDRLMAKAYAEVMPFLETAEIGAAGIYGNPQFYARDPDATSDDGEALHHGHRARMVDSVV